MLIIIIVIFLIAALAYFKTRRSTWPLNYMSCTCNRSKPNTQRLSHSQNQPTSSTELETDENGNVLENEIIDSENEESEPLECKYMGRVSETSTDEGEEDNERMGMLDEIEEEERDKAGDVEVIVDVEKMEGGLEDVEVLRVHHKSSGDSQSWRSVKVTSSVLNYKHHPRRRTKVQ
ncbi:uncharacterized protein LOC128999304 [Macrosteles quadrilineatus]|uniref:uncharacterized protein LOC128999304 n=1 Tax=Macrosteles quadrilineatus TaxID=74068 RepID=UPI0023E1DFBE|nr:uncharacterized protein LOC128999304 [Macrosteles quadrilineatus]